ncbi:hypothetical protein DFQ28_008941 [Apophysomyces sp. BC1034]|nr:hypothetical protein DFQ29_007573 [Apophysomyces sp. BC1021]KAG0185703.1 hypothetical protein DFQ28_008941 [Apophysomyces sp. BC1034]
MSFELVQSFPLFPEGTARIEVPHPRKEDGSYDVKNINIGWCMLRQDGYPAAQGGRMFTKKCAGSVRCLNPMCMLELVDIRPKLRQRDMDAKFKEGCNACGSPLIHNTCGARVHFLFHDDKYFMCSGKGEGGDRHSHGKYEAKHLSEQGREQLKNIVCTRPEATSKSLVVGLHQGVHITSVRDIDNDLCQNLDRTRYERRKILK